MKGFHPRENGFPPIPLLSERCVRPREGGLLPDPPSMNFTDSETKEGMHEMNTRPQISLRHRLLAPSHHQTELVLKALVADTQTRDRDSGCNA